jgi:hypothetical protein
MPKHLTTTDLAADHATDTTAVHGIADTSALALTADLTSHAADTTAIHGVADTSALALTADLTAHSADTTAIHGIADTSALALTTDITAHAADSTTVHGIVDTAALALSSDLTTHAADTTAIHGIADTSALALTADLAIRTANRQTSSYTLALTDPGKVVEMDLAGANTLTFPPNSSVAIPVGSVGEYLQYGAGQTTLTPGAAVTIHSSGGKLKTAAQYAQGSWRKIAADEFVVSGDLAL